MIKEVTGHTMTTENRSVTRHSSSWNTDYQDTDRYLVCSCGFEKLVSAGLNGQSQEERLLALEHVITVVATEVLLPAAT